MLELLASIKCERIVIVPQVFLNLYIEGFERLRTNLEAFFSSLLIFYFDLEARAFDHAPDFWGRGNWCGEVTVLPSKPMLSIDLIMGSDVEQDDLFLGYSQREGDAI